MMVWTIVQNSDGEILVCGVFTKKPSFEQFLSCTRIHINYMSEEEIEILKTEFENGYVSCYCYNEIYIEEHPLI